MSNFDDYVAAITRLCPDWTIEDVDNAAWHLDLRSMENDVESDLAALPIRGQEDEVTLQERIDPRWLAHKIIDQQDIIDDLERKLALREETIMTQDRKIAQLFRTNRVFAEALACTADRVDVPPLDETWRQEQNGRWL